jgi:hypothetical protein
VCVLKAVAMSLLDQGTLLEHDWKTHALLSNGSNPSDHTYCQESESFQHRCNLPCYQYIRWPRTLPKLLACVVVLSFCVDHLMKPVATRRARLLVRPSPSKHCSLSCIPMVCPVVHVSTCLLVWPGFNGVFDQTTTAYFTRMQEHRHKRYELSSIYSAFIAPCVRK